MNPVIISIFIIVMLETLSSIFIASLAYRRINHRDLLPMVKKEGKMIVDIVRKRITKVGKSIKNITEQVDEIYKSGGG